MRPRSPRLLPSDSLLCTGAARTRRLLRQPLCLPFKYARAYSLCAVGRLSRRVRPRRAPLKAKVKQSVSGGDAVPTKPTSYVVVQSGFRTDSDFVRFYHQIRVGDNRTDDVCLESVDSQCITNGDNDSCQFSVGKLPDFYEKVAKFLIEIRQLLSQNHVVFIF